MIIIKKDYARFAKSSNILQNFHWIVSILSLKQTITLFHDKYMYVCMVYITN